MKSATGYAYADDEGQIVVGTVCPTEIGAKVNAIAVATYNNVIPTRGMSKEDIERMFLNATGGAGKIIRVDITKAKEQEEA